MGEAWELARDLVRIDSSDPGAYEGEVERYLRRLVEGRLAGLPAWLASAVEVRELEVLPGRTNLMVTLPGLGDGPRLVFDCHMDTVTLGEGWADDAPALGGVVRDGRLYGRGACDMKGGLACATSALLSMVDEAALRGELPRRSLSLLCTVDEEDFMRGVEAAVREGWVGPDDWVLDTEPTDGQIQVAHKGRTWFELTMEGVTAHASQPWEGADAVAAMAEVVCEVRRAMAARPEHPELGRPTVTFGQIAGGYRPYVVPDSCTVWIDMRLVPPTGSAEARAMVEGAIASAERAVPGTHGSYRVTGDRPAVERDPGSPLLAALCEAVEEACGEPARVGFFTGYTDTAVIAGTCANRNCMSYGPGSLALAHKPNEYVPRADVERVERVLTQLARRALWG